MNSKNESINLIIVFNALLSGKHKKKTQLDCCKFVIFCISHFENTNKKITMKIKKC